jgi:hypothetical protein
VPDLEKPSRDPWLAQDPERVLSARVVALKAAARVAAVSGRSCTAADVVETASAYEAWLLREVPRSPRG